MLEFPGVPLYVPAITQQQSGAAKQDSLRYSRKLFERRLSNKYLHQEAWIRRYAGCHMASSTCWTMSLSLTSVKPSIIAASATAAATVTVTLRRSSIWGRREAPGNRTATRLDKAFAAAASMPTLIK